MNLKAAWAMWNIKISINETPEEQIIQLIKGQIN
jgi:hypothetical protein